MASCFRGGRGSESTRANPGGGVPRASGSRHGNGRGNRASAAAQQLIGGRPRRRRPRRRRDGEGFSRVRGFRSYRAASRARNRVVAGSRSEERRVGKEGRGRCGRGEGKEYTKEGARSE